MLGYNPKLHFNRNASERYIKLVNRLQNVSYKIGKNVLDYVNENKERLILNNELGNLEILTNKPQEFSDRQDVEAYRKEYARALLDNSILNVCTLFNNQVFYNAWFMDFRFRLYTRGFPFTIQAGSLARVLVTIENKGCNKLTVEESDILEELVYKKLQDKKLKGYEKFELHDLLENKFILHEKHAKIGLDATASGLQMIGLFINDEKLLKQTKLLASDTNQDIYEIFRKNIEKKIEHVKCFSKIVITRKLAKSVLMTYAYNQGVQGRSKTIYDAIGVLTYKEA